ncbi:hypothetical protein HA42_01920 [Pantoea deleyi]|uniref:Uncharacterized protein n=1 Tax=Pantoea deleyi TaxID=470932 RepID=A0A506Q438_9GAMM|nr:hypothetical protein [Pantoea deleyi]ORM85836.1 hypothetical protein HA42_01920 [Pantoea deleyi]TPV40452.1 hypothetical protein FJW01_12095 [Pantoea deleyi]
MKILIFIIILSASWIFIPEGFIKSLVEGHISGDGESAMDSFELTVILLKAVFSLLLAFIGVWLYRKADQR